MSETKTNKKKLTSKTKKQVSMYGSIVFGVGLAIALIAGVMNIQSSLANQIIGATLIVIGLIVGVLNITREEAIKFMIASIIIVTLLQSFLSGVIQLFSIQSQFVTQMLTSTFINLTMLVIPAAVFVALKTAFEVAKDEE